MNIQKLSRVLKPVSEEKDADAAVALLLKVVEHGVQVLFVKRVENQTDPWSGQMALPGGKRDVRDQNLKQTVVRETLEETNINLLDRARFLGVMDAQRSRRRPEMKVLPFVVLLEHEPSIRLSEKELEGFVWVSVEELVKHEGTVEFSFGRFPAYIIEDYVIWGLTYEIMKKFVENLESVVPC